MDNLKLQQLRHMVATLDNQTYDQFLNEMADKIRARQEGEAALAGALGLTGEAVMDLDHERSEQ